jgi:hypothetical protein
MTRYRALALRAPVTMRSTSRRKAVLSGWAPSSSVLPRRVMAAMASASAISSSLAPLARATGLPDVLVRGGVTGGVTM